MSEDLDFDGYWLRFVRDHLKPTTQYAHLVGDLWSVSLLVRGMVRRKFWRVALSPLPLLLFSQFSHRYIEHNQPLRFLDNPTWYLRCEIKMALHLLQNTMPDEIERALASSSS
jgi:hypothetical protein